jgi:membrane fusion protein (multidrug efflux system)
MKAFSIVRHPCIGIAKAGHGALKQARKVARKELVRCRTQLWVASVIALSLVPGVVFGSDVLEQKFDGIVVPRLWVQVVPQVEGVISRILVTPGQRVSKGDILFEIDPEAFALDVRVAQSELDEARARLSMAEDAAGRQAELLMKNSTSKQLARQTEIEVEIARAVVARKESALAKTQLALSRTRIAAPLSGTVGRPRVAPGAFVKAGVGSAGTVLADIAQLDPILVSYYIPDVERERVLAKARTSAVGELFQRSTLSLELASGRIYEHSSKPEYHGGEIDQSSGMMTLWAEFSNPNNVLVPGLKVRVISRFGD